MERFETEHYVFHFEKDSLAHLKIQEIAAEQERCYREITQTLGVAPNFKIQYYLCATPEAVGKHYGDNEPCNGFARMPDWIYAVYNEKVKCVGAHEDAHIISYCINRPESAAIREGLAMYFDKVWWGVPNREWVPRFLKTGKYTPVSKLLHNECFFGLDCAVTYPIVGAFTEFLVNTYGIEKYLAFYGSKEDVFTAFVQSFGRTAENAESDFLKNM